jgi:alcohol dehydrogenase, propanol-preferring
MLAVRSHAPGDGIRVEQLPTPEPAGTEIRLRVAGCGVCHTDLHIIGSDDRIRVTRPVTLGHEVTGWIDEVGDAAQPALNDLGLSVRDPVVVFGGWGCGRCERCVADEENACALRRSPGLKADGGFAEYMIVPHPRHLIPLGPDLDPVASAPLADAALTPWRAISRAEGWLARARRVLVIGVGGLGQFAVQYLRRAGAFELIAIDIDAAKRERALGLGADRMLSPADAALAELEASVDVLFDFVGTDATLADAARFVARGGLVSLVGEAGGRLAFGFRALEVESYVTTTSWGSRRDLAEVVAMARAGAISWTVETLPLARAAEALDRLARGRVDGRLVLVP